MESIADKYLMKKFQEKEQINNVESEEKNNNIEIEIDRLVEFRKQQPFSMYSQEKKDEVKESIKRFGILNPIIVRAIENSKYEIISGHNRVEIMQELGKKTIPATIIDVDDDDASLIMIDTNLCTRDEISPIEKGKAYKMKLEILKRKRKEMQVNSEVEDNSLIREKQSIDELIEECNESKSQIYRYIALTELNIDMQKLVENGQMAISVGSEVATLNSTEQEILYIRRKTKKAEISRHTKNKEFRRNYL